MELCFNSNKNCTEAKKLLTNALADCPVVSDSKDFLKGLLIIVLDIFI